MTHYSPSSVSSSDAILRPTCPKCSTTMMLARIEPHSDGHDLRTFECPECDHSESSVVRFRQAAIGWRTKRETGDVRD
jgi:transposase-like protein